MRYRPAIWIADKDDLAAEAILGRREVAVNTLDRRGEERRQPCPLEPYAWRGALVVWLEAISETLFEGVEEA